MSYVKLVVLQRSVLAEFDQKHRSARQHARCCYCNWCWSFRRSSLWNSFVPADDIEIWAARFEPQLRGNGCIHFRSRPQTEWCQQAFRIDPVEPLMPTTDPEGRHNLSRARKPGMFKTISGGLHHRLIFCRPAGPGNRANHVRSVPFMAGNF